MFGPITGTATSAPAPYARRMDPSVSAPAAWSGLELLSEVHDGNRNRVWRGRCAGEPVSVRRSRRSAASLGWELDVLEQVGGHGVGVPSVIRTDDERMTSGGLVVQRWIDGRQPSSVRDWQLVAATLRTVHAVAVGQRPGAHAVTGLGRNGRSIDADLGLLPDEVATVVLGVFASVHDAPVSLIHGDPGPSNIRIDDDDRVWLLDWDESRVDVSWHDLSNLGVRVLDDETHARAVALSHAWEAVNGWVAETAYARRRYDALLRCLG